MITGTLRRLLEDLSLTRTKSMPYFFRNTARTRFSYATAGATTSTTLSCINKMRSSQIFGELTCFSWCGRTMWIAHCTEEVWLSRNSHWVMSLTTAINENCLKSWYRGLVESSKFPSVNGRPKLYRNSKLPKAGAIATEVRRRIYLQKSLNWKNWTTSRRANRGNFASDWLCCYL